jgi:hypothetical protein
MVFNFNGMSDFEVAEFIEEEGPFSEKEYRDIMDAIFRRKGYWNEFERYIRAALSRTFGITDHDTQDDIIQEASVWLMDFLENKMDLSRISSGDRFSFANMIFSLHGITKEIEKIYKRNEREQKSHGGYESEDDYLEDMGGYSDDRESLGNAVINRFRSMLSSVQRELFDFLGQGYTVRDAAKEFGKSLGWVQKEKDKMFKLYQTYVLTEAKKVLKIAIREAIKNNRGRV